MPTAVARTLQYRLRALAADLAADGQQRRAAEVLAMAADIGRYL